jgi:type I restriction enzyme S subunit
MWELSKLSEVCTIYNGGTPDSKDKVYWGGEVQWLTPKDMGKLTNRFVFQTERQITNEGLANSSTKLIPENSVILSCRAPIGHLAINKVPMSFNQGCKGLVPNKKIIAQFLYYFLLLSKDLLNKLGTGATFKEISGKTLANVPISVPPIPHQQHIVARLDAGFAEIDKLILSGEIKKSEIKKLYASSITSIFFSDKDTKVIEIKEIAKIKGGKRLPKGEKLTSEVTKFPYIRVKDFTKEGSINEDSIKYISEDVKKRISRYTISVEDVYISIAGTIGRTGVIPSSLNNANLTENAAKIVLDNNCLRDYFYYFTTSASFINQTIAQTRATAQPKLSLERLEKVKLPLCSINKQKFIVDKAHKIQKYKNLLINIIDKEIKLYKVLKSKIIQDLIKI